MSFGVVAIGCLALQAWYWPQRLEVSVVWADGITQANRQAAEVELGLIAARSRDAEWTYRLNDYSPVTVAAIVSHPAVRLTGQIDRDEARVILNAPALPAFVKWILGRKLGLWLGLAGLIVCVATSSVSLTHLTVALQRAKSAGPAPWVIGLLILIYAWELARTAWIADDAAITLRTVLNFIHGHGARFNLDERVQAYTHPLWFILLSAFSLIDGNVFAAALWLSVLCSLATLFILLRCRHSLPGAIIVVFGLLLSRAYVDFSASGLENPLAHLIVLSTAILGLGVSHQASERDLRWLCLGVGAAFLTRPDLGLLIVPLVTLVLLRQRASWTDLAWRISYGVAPILVWATFATYYYGSPFPNPAYAKLGAGVPLIERIFQGGRYFLHSWDRDPLTLLIIGLGTAFGVGAGGASAAVAGGNVLYLAYVASIGGDFMEGRFFTCATLLSALLIIRANLRPWKLVMVSACIVGLGAINLSSTLLSPVTYADEVIAPDGIADERGYYFQQYGWLNAGEEVFGVPDWRVIPENLNAVLIVCGGLGFQGISEGPAVHLIDVCGLADPLLARLPAMPNPQWRIGHFERAVPVGYEESIITRDNRLADAQMRTYYDSIRLVTRGNLNDPKRLWEIIRLNIGLVRRPDITTR
ncbi:MAG: hypothetical protein ABL986_14270 [Vicinamibacterales bacterium]